MNRREFLTAALGGVALAALPRPALNESRKSASYRVVLFDAFPIFDPLPVFTLAEEIFPGRGGELSALWKNRQFEYMWLRTLTGQYADFPSVTRDALTFATESLKLKLTLEIEERLIGRYFQLGVWPDVIPALRRLKEAGLRLGFLSNFSQRMLETNIKYAGLEDYFELALSTDRVKAFKPDPRAYQMGLDAFKADRKEVIFAAFAGWDAAGAEAFGYPTFWVNRAKAVREELPGRADEVGSLEDLVGYVTTG